MSHANKFFLFANVVWLNIYYFGYDGYSSLFAPDYFPLKVSKSLAKVPKAKRQTHILMRNCLESCCQSVGQTPHNINSVRSQKCLINVACNRLGVCAINQTNRILIATKIESMPPCNQPICLASLPTSICVCIRPLTITNLTFSSLKLLLSAARREIKSNMSIW